MLNDPNWDKKVKPELDEISQHLLLAADYIEKHGWCQYSLQDQEGRTCLEGAILKTTPFNHASHTHLVNVLERLSLVTGIRTGWVWNDLPERTKDQVVNALREAAYKTVT